ncbi:cytosolic factor, phosphatidylinositol/phosphatidylcholine transfer protein [Entophlyctis luteolus]|nr:cytosolic factor, phosphatidylinositol/phosphatidylcholine transfer protein [Entophlyctis luteolus]KAJ3394914.1 cytosolic factor, phosphatidylinositol/phosphatidylcholine transfer protein [Entophlyctis sp. JEL0112]
MASDPVAAAALTKFKQALQKAASPLYTPVVDADDALLLRFLRARRLDVDKAKAMLDAYLTWRVEFKVDEIVKTFRFPEYDRIMELYPRFYHKTDKFGRPVYFEVMSTLSSKLLDGDITTPERFLKYYVREYEKTVQYRFAALSLKAGKTIDKSCTIMDLKNVPIMQFNSIRKFLAQVTHIAQNYYPETLGSMFLINAPLVFQGVWKVVKGMLDENTVAKISILGASYQKELLQVIDAENLPAEYGGSCLCSCVGGCRRSDKGPWNDGTVAGYPIDFWENINVIPQGDLGSVVTVGARSSVAIGDGKFSPSSDVGAQ